MAKRAAPSPRIASCFLRRSASLDAITAALRAYEPSRNISFTTSDPDTLDASGPGWTVRIHTIRKLRPILDEIKCVGTRLEDLRGAAMVLAIEATLDLTYPEGSILEARAPFGPTITQRSWESTVTCEALNIKLAPYGAILYDVALGFYPSV